MPARIMPQADQPSIGEEEEYNSSSDEDFNPTTAPEADEESADSSDDEVAPTRTITKTTGKLKRKRKDEVNEDIVSGDEITIQEGWKARKRRKAGAKGQDDNALSDDEGDEGGLIKTRSQRRQEQKERRPLASLKGATADVDAIWTKLSSAPIGRPLDPPAPSGAPEKPPSRPVAKGTVDRPAEPRPTTRDTEELITIKRTYNFAGETHTETKLVLRSSAEARLYLASQNPNTIATSTSAGGTTTADVDFTDGPVQYMKPSRKPLFRPSRFEANPAGEVRNLSPSRQLTWREKNAKAAGYGPLSPFDPNTTAGVDTGKGKGRASMRPPLAPEKAQKLNTVDKSRLDWVGFVDKEGIAEELEEHGKSKKSYMGQQEFLAEVERRKDEERRVAKFKV